VAKRADVWFVHIECGTMTDKLSGHVTDGNGRPTEPESSSLEYRVVCGLNSCVAGEAQQKLCYSKAKPSRNKAASLLSPVGKRVAGILPSASIQYFGRRQ